MSTKALDPKSGGARDYFEDYADKFISSYDDSSWLALKRLKREIWRDLHERERLALKLTSPHQGVSVLDIGCGDGRYARHFINLGVKSYDGIDFSETMIQKAQVISRDYPQTNFEVLSFEEMPDEKRYDHIIAMGVMDYVADTKSFLEKALSMARQSIVVSFPKWTFIRGSLRIARYKLRGCDITLFRLERILTILNSLENASSYRIIPIAGYGMDFVVRINPR